MTETMPLSSAVINLSDNFDDLLESLSTLQQLGDLRADILDERQIMHEALQILYQSYKATSCTIYSWSGKLENRPDLTASDALLAIDSNGTIFQRAATKIELLFINNSISENSMQHCNDCATLGSEYQCTHLETSIISVPLRINDQLTGVITISHSNRAHFNSWGYRLMQIFSTFLSQQLTICRLEKNLKELK